MNSLKTMATAAIMVGCLYGVYILLNRTPGDSNSPEMSQEWDSMKTGAEIAGTGEIPSVDVSLPSTNLAPSGLTEVSAEEAFASTGSPSSYSNTPQPTAPIGVPVAVSAPIGDQFDPSGATTPNHVPGNMMSPQNTQPGNYAPTDLNGVNNQKTGWEETLQKAKQELAEDRLADAHMDLSRAYADPNTTPEKKKEIEPLLDQLAGTVVYSRQHLLEQPYKVRPNDSLEAVAQRFNVPVGLLAKINGLDPTAPLQPGQELKVIQGSFNATVDLSDHVLTLTTADGRYAGRFPIGVGPNAANITRSSVYMVTDKTDTTELAKQGRTRIGRRWIGLGEQLGLHGTDTPSVIGTSNGNGAISLSDRDIEDVYDILSVGSKVTIQP